MNEPAKDRRFCTFHRALGDYVYGSEDPECGAPLEPSDRIYCKAHKREYDAESAGIRQMIADQPGGW